MAIKFTLTAEQRAENARKVSMTRQRQLKEKYGGMYERYTEGRMFRLSNTEAGKLLGVSGSTVGRMLAWRQRLEVMSS